MTAAGTGADADADGRARAWLVPALLCVLVVLAGCGAPGAVGEASDGGGSASSDVGNGDVPDASADGAGAAGSPVASVDPAAPIAVNASDGLNATELNRTVARAMARIEQLRGLEFESSVPVRVIGREQYRENQPFGGASGSAWNNQVWEALLLVGEDRNVTRVFERTLGGAVTGYYTPDENRIVVVSDAAQPRVDRGTLVHELVHALQDQRFGIGSAPPTQDRQLARNGVVEGEATLIERRYQQRCGAQWDCIDVPSTFANAGSVDRGVLSVLRYPYVVGPDFVTAIKRRGGWAAVDRLYADYPRSTREITHPSIYPTAPRNVTVPDRSGEAWTRFDHDPVADTVGQASLSVMLDENGVAGDSYDNPAVDGWRGDTLVPYRSGDRRGYVWALTWSSPADARAFESAYLDALDRLGADRTEGGYVVPESSPFGDAFRVTREGTRVRIVNGPTVDTLDRIHAPA